MKCMSFMLKVFIIVAIPIVLLRYDSVLANTTVAWKQVVPNATGLGSYTHLYYPAFGSTHFGVDILANCGKSIYPLYDGKVVARLEDYGRSSPGNAIMIRHPGKGRNGNDLYTIYLHLQSDPLTIGEAVKTNIPIGKIGETGFTCNKCPKGAGACHTHFEIRNFFDPTTAGNGWYHSKSLGCRTKNPNIYACGDVREKDWAKNDWENPKSYQVGQKTPQSSNGCNNIKSDIPKPLATAIVFDHSGSMAGEQKIDYARKATLAFPQYMRQDDLLSVAVFSNDASVPPGLELKNKGKISPALHSILPTIGPSGQTNIGAGLDSGLVQLCTVSGERVKKGALLLSDGMNNVGEYNTVVQQYKDYNIPIYTVKFGNEVSEQILRDIAAETGGICMDSNQQTVAGVYSGIFDAINGNSIVATYHDHMSPTGKLAYQVNVTPGADSMNINTSWQGSKLKTVFTSPSGNTFSGDQLPGQADRFESGPITQFTQILNPEPGDWKLDISWDDPPTEPERVNLIVSEHTDVYTSILGFSPEYTAGDTVTINVHASELDGGNNKIPLRNTRVKVKVQIPGPEVIRMILAQSSNLRVYNDVQQDITREVELFDDGEHNDYNKDDGIFGGFFTETKLNGSYIVTAHIEGSKLNGGYVDRRSTGSFQVGSLQDTEVTTSQIMQYSRSLEDRMRNHTVNPLGGMQSSGVSTLPDGNQGRGTKRKKRSRSLMDSISN